MRLATRTSGTATTLGAASSRSSGTSNGDDATVAAMTALIDKVLSSAR